MTLILITSAGGLLIIFGILETILYVVKKFRRDVDRIKM